MNEMAPPRGDMNLIGVASRVGVALILLAAALGKIELPQNFAEEVAAYRVAPVAWVNAIAYLLPWLEVVLATSLITGVWRRESRLIVLVLLVGFTGLKIYSQVAGLHISCGCFSGTFAFLSKIFEGPRGIALNLGLLALVATDFYSDARRNAVASRTDKS